MLDSQLRACALFNLITSQSLRLILSVSLRLSTFPIHSTKSHPHPHLPIQTRAYTRTPRQVIAVNVTQYILTNNPTAFGTWFCCVMPPMLIWRYFIFKKKKWIYFMHDFCYWVSAEHCTP